MDDELAAAKESWQKVTEARRVAAELTKAHEADLVAAYKKHQSYVVVAEAVGRNPDGVRQVLLRLGVTLRGRGRPRRADS